MLNGYRECVNMGGGGGGQFYREISIGISDTFSYKKKDAIKHYCNIKVYLKNVNARWD